MRALHHSAHRCKCYGSARRVQVQHICPHSVQPAVVASRSASRRAAVRYPSLAHRDARSTPRHPPPLPPPARCSSRALRRNWAAQRFFHRLRRYLLVRHLLRRRRRSLPLPPQPPRQPRWPPQRPRGRRLRPPLRMPTAADHRLRRRLRLRRLHRLRRRLRLRRLHRLRRRHHRCCRLQPPPAGTKPDHGPPCSPHTHTRLTDIIPT